TAPTDAGDSFGGTGAPPGVSPPATRLGDPAGSPSPLALGPQPPARTHIRKPRPQKSAEGDPLPGTALELLILKNPLRGPRPPAGAGRPAACAGPVTLAPRLRTASRLAPCLSGLAVH